MASLYDQEPDGLTGINDLAEREIFPKLRELGERPAQQMRKRKYRFFGLAILVTLALSLLFGGPEGLAFSLPLFTIVVVPIFYLVYRLGRGVTGEIRAEVLEIVTGSIARHLGLRHEVEKGEEFARECMAVGVTGADFDSFHIGSFLSGKFAEHDVRCCLLSMGEHENRSMEFTQNSFSGTLYAATTGEAMVGRTILMPQLYVANFTNDWALGKEFEKVDVGTAEFQKWFVVYSTDAANAKALLNEKMQSRLVSAVQGIAKTGASIALVDGTIYLSTVDISKHRLIPKMKPDWQADDPEPIRVVADAMAEIAGRLKALAGV